MSSKAIPSQSVTRDSSLRVIFVGVLLWNCMTGRAQTMVHESAQRFRTDTSLVLVPVTVTDFRSAIINDLGKDSFAVFDNGKPQPISAFYMEDVPCSVG